MISLKNFTTSFNDGPNLIIEGRRPKVVDNGEQIEFTDAKGRKVYFTEKEYNELNALKGKSSKQNGSDGEWAIEEPQGVDADGKQYLNLKPNEMTDNQRILAQRFRNEQAFFVMGEAGWGKTAEITAMAHKFGRTVITVYLDKADPTDLDGVIAATSDERGKLKAGHAPLAWAEYMLIHPEKKFLLFFDEMNQADGQVQNALMPIIEKHVIGGKKFDNYMVGAAGNFEFENGEIDQSSGKYGLSKPLQQRLFPFIWDCRTPQTWKSHFEWAHKNWDSKIGKEPIDKTASLSAYWNSPRDITKLVYQFINSNLQYKDCYVTPKQYFNSLLEFAVYDELDKENKRLQKDLQEFAEYVINYVSTGGKLEGKKAEVVKTKDKNQVNKTIKENLMRSLEDGYLYFDESIGGDNNLYVCTLENCITEIFNPAESGITAEVLKKIVKQMEASGHTIKYKTNKEGYADAKENGYLIPGENKNGNNFLIKGDLHKILNAMRPTSKPKQKKIRPTD